MESGARAAISGYRLQSLYVLDLLLQESGEGREFVPEGREDLAVYEAGKLVRVVQVKAYSAPLVLSDLEPRKQESFLRRLLRLPEEVTVDLVSFGSLGSELDAVRENDAKAIGRLGAKLIEYGYSEDNVATVFRRLRVTLVDEEELGKRVFAFIGNSLAAGDPQSAFDLLIWWLLQAAEFQASITGPHLRDRLLAIGQYFSERAAHHEEWFASIKPLQEEVSDRADRKRLEEEYYRGAAARYSHILAGLDVRRLHQLELIEKEFQAGKRVVILHGASGQGKTSLALRYLHDAVPGEWRFMISRIDDRRHAARMAQAVAAHLHAIDSPLYLLVDVAPRELEWVTFVSELLDIEKVRVIVAIREEDLARKTASDQELGFPAALRLEFSEREAEEVYAQLVARGDLVNPFPTFAEAWETFGGRGPLLEFVYLITQTKSLLSVLEGQVRRLRDDVQTGQLEPGALPLLQSCAVATAFEVRVLLRPLAKVLGLRDVGRVMALFENEYLVRMSPDRVHVEALHSVRSRILMEVLGDPGYAPTVEAALAVLPFVPEADLEVFVRYFLSRLPESWGLLEKALAELELRTWSGAAGLGRSLLWWGLKSYIEANRSLLDEAEQMGGESWRTFVLSDIAGAGEADPIEQLLDLIQGQNPAAAIGIRKIRSRLSPASEMFAPLTNWLEGFHLESPPKGAADWEGYAELAFWAARLQLTIPGTGALARAEINALPINLVAQISLALGSNSESSQAAFLAEHHDAILARLREEMNVLLLTVGDEVISAHFLVPLELLPGLSSVLSGRPEDGGSEGPDVGLLHDSGDVQKDERPGAVFNDEAVRLAEVLRAVFPGRKTYETQGYGHQLTRAGVEFPVDDTHKRMPPSSLPNPWLVRVNAVIHSLDIYQSRPPTWKEYARILLSIRETIATTFLKLQRTIGAYFARGTARSLFGSTLTVELWQETKRAAGGLPYLPVVAVDEWGLSSETQRQQLSSSASSTRNIASTFAFRRHAAVSKGASDYSRAVTNFLRQAESILNVHGFIGRNPAKRSEILEIAKKDFGYSEDNVRLSKYNLFQAMNELGRMQEEFRRRLGSLVNGEMLARVERRERALFPELWVLWYEFCHFPGRRQESIEQRLVQSFRGELDLLRERLGHELERGRNFHASFFGRDFFWEGRPALVLFLRPTALEELETARKEMMGCLGLALGGAGLGTLRQYALDYFWPFVVVVPVVDSLPVGGGAWVIPSFVFYHEVGETPDRQWLRPLRPLSPAQLRALDVEPPALSEIWGLEALQQRLAHLQIIYAHTATLRDAASEFDDIGKAILQRYFSRLAGELAEISQEIRRLIPPTFDALRDATSLGEPELAGLFAPLMELQERLEIVGDTEDVDGNLDEVEQLIGFMHTIRWLVG